MKKNLAALTGLAVAGVASAQSSVTLFGVLDASVSHYAVSSKTNVTYSPLGVPLASSFTPSRSQTVLSNGNNSSSRLGFRVTEDLGGGLAAGLWLEARLGNDSGSLETNSFAFSRRSTVSLSGGFGELRLGRDNTPSFQSNTTFDPYNAVGVGTTVIQQVNGTNRTSRGVFGASTGPFADPNATRASNSIGYFLPPTLGGFYGQLMYALHENIQTDAPVAGTTAYTGIGSSRGRYAGGRFGYAKGPLDIAVAYGEGTLGNYAGTLALNAAGAVTTAGFRGAYSARFKTANLAGSYDLGVAKLMVQLSQTRTTFDQNGYIAGGALVPAVSDASKNTGFLLGAVVPVGPGQIKLSYSRVKTTLPGLSVPDPTVSKFAVGYVHYLSKRTTLYATVARLSNKNGSALAVNSDAGAANPMTGAPNASSTGYDFGLRHSF